MKISKPISEVLYPYINASFSSKSEIGPVPLCNIRRQSAVVNTSVKEYKSIVENKPIAVDPDKKFSWFRAHTNINPTILVVHPTVRRINNIFR